MHSLQTLVGIAVVLLFVDVAARSVIGGGFPLVTTFLTVIVTVCRLIVSGVATLLRRLG